MSTLYLIRHADAGDPWEFPKDDNKRPLSRFGKEQAREMAALVKGFGIRHMFTSHADRCLQTVQTFKRVINCDIEETTILAQNRANVITPFMRSLPQETALICTHQDNIYAFLKQINEEDGVAIPKRIVVPSGCFYVLERASTVFTSVAYVPPGGAPPSPSELDAEDEVWID